MSEKFQASSEGVNKTFAENAHRNTSFSPEVRAKQEIAGFAGEVQKVYEDLSRYAKTEVQKEFLNEEMARFQVGYAAKYNDHLASKGRCFSVLITGGSGFNNRRHEKANNAEHNKYVTAQDFKEKAIVAIKRELKKLAVEEAGGEIAVLEAKILRLEKAHEVMVESNKIIHKKNMTIEEQVKLIVDKTGLKEETVKDMFKPNCFWDIGFVGWQLQNSNANIRSSKKHLEELKVRDVKPSSELTFSGGHIEDNAEVDRVQIIFNEIPSEDLRTKLKVEGWRWSPFNKAWQRKRTPMALNSAKRITGNP